MTSASPGSNDRLQKLLSDIYDVHAALETLQALHATLQKQVTELSSVLVRQLKRRDHQRSRATAKCNLMTAIVQAYSRKRSVDARLQFSLEPPQTDAGYEQWLSAMRAVSRLPDGIPQNFRRKLWLTMANDHLKQTDPQWHSETCHELFSEKITTEDDKLGAQIIKDLHRTGWAGLGGEHERVLLKRVLLAYARHNKAIGYCQGFNVIAALILDIVEWKEADALAVMILLVEHILPAGYFDQTLRALTVDMAVLAELMHQRLPKLAEHLEHLQKKSESEFEPPVSNVFTMQWLLTLFATCLPRTAVLRIWDSLLLDGSEMLLRTALAIWARTSKRACQTQSADEFYELMNDVCRQLSQLSHQDCNKLLQVIYQMSEFPYTVVAELREKYTWNIQPFTSTLKQLGRSLLHDEDDSNAGIGPCLAGIMSGNGGKPALRATDLATLQKQYKLMKQRQKQAAVILQNAYAAGQARINDTLHIKRGANGTSNATSGSPSLISPFSPTNKAFNHLYGQPKDFLSTWQTRHPPHSTLATINGTLLVSAKPVQPQGRCRNSSETQSTKTQQKSAKGDSRARFLSIKEDKLRNWCNVSTASSSSVRPRSSIDDGSLTNGITSSGTIRPVWSSSDSLNETLSQCVTPINISENSLKRSCTVDNMHTDEQINLFLFRDCESEFRQRRASESDVKPLSHAALRRLLNMAKKHHCEPQKPRRKISSTSTNEPDTHQNGSQNQHQKGTPLNARPQRLTKEQLNASKSILQAAGQSLKANLMPDTFNPFPTKHHSRLIEREKQFGLY